MQVSNNLIDALKLEKKVEANKGNDAVSKFLKANVSKIFASEGISFGEGTDTIFDAEKVTEEDIKQAMDSQSSEFIRETLAAFSKYATTQDLTKLSEENNDIKNTDVETIVTQTDRIKAYLAAWCDDYVVVGDISDAAIDDVAGASTVTANAIKKMTERNVAVNEENINEVNKAIEMAGNISGVSESAMSYIISNNLPATIENLYKAEHSSGNAIKSTYSSGYYSTGSAYLQKSSDNIDWDSLQGQIEKVIENVGKEVNEETCNEAKWLISNHLPLTEETLLKVDELMNLEFPLNEEQLVDCIVDSMSVGNSAASAYITKELSMVDRAKEAYEVINKATDANIVSVINENKTLNIENLKNAIIQEQSDQSPIEAISEQSSQSPTEIISEQEPYTSAVEMSEEDIKLITAKRQLEEIRLQMSVEANLRLLKNGVSIETKSIEELINELKAAEDAYYNKLFSGFDVDATEENVNLFKEVTTKVDNIKFIPSYTIGKVVNAQTDSTINAVHDEGMALKTTLDKAGESYDTVMTKPRPDMGDEISKAFRNIDYILEDMDMELSEANRRAVRILGYNSMEITEENIMKVKSVDSQINAMLKDMTPINVIRMIREGFNPLNKEISELNEHLSEMASQNGNSDESYGEFLWNLEKSDSITPEERESYIGMYRLLASVEKTDGAVIGALVNQNAEITLNNLLSGVRTRKNKGIDVSVDESFGGLENLKYKSKSIDKQLSSSFNSNTSDESSKNSDESQIYYNNLVKDILSELTPDKLNTLMQGQDVMNMSLEKFKESLSEVQEDSEIQKEYLQEQLEMFKEASKAETSVIKILEEYDQPMTLNNVIAANSLFSERGSMFKKLLENADKNGKTEKEAELKAASEGIIDYLTDEDTFKEAYDNLTGLADEVTEERLEAEQPTSVSVKDLMLLRGEIRLSSKLSNEEKYQIPVMINNEITAVSLTIVHDQNSQGKIAITMSTETYGNVEALFSNKENELSGYIASDSQAGTAKLTDIINDFGEKLSEIGIITGSINCMYSDKLNINKFESDIQNESEAKTSTADLYKSAKAFIETISEPILDLG